MPGGGGTISAFLAYNEAKRWSRRQEEFGTGSPEGIAAPEAANNTVACTALVPMLSLGIPSSNSSAVLLSGFLVHGLVPGPMLFVKNPEVVNGLYRRAPHGQHRDGDCWLPHHDAMSLAGEPAEAVSDGVHLRVRCLRRVLGRGEPVSCRACARLRRHRIRHALLQGAVSPMVLGVVLGFMVESNYRRALALSDGDHLTFFRDPISAGLLGIAALVVIAPCCDMAVRDRPRGCDRMTVAEPSPRGWPSRAPG